MKMFELLPRPLGSIFRKLTHLTCNSRNVRLASPQRCSPTRNGRFVRPCNRSPSLSLRVDSCTARVTDKRRLPPYTYTASGSSPVQSASPKRVPLGPALRNCGFVPKPCFCGLSARPSDSPLKTLCVFRRLSAPTVTALGTLGSWAKATHTRRSLRGKARLLPRAASTIRVTMLRRRDTASLPRSRLVSHHANRSLAVPLRMLLTRAALTRPSIRRVFLRSPCARRRPVDSLTFARGRKRTLPLTGNVAILAAFLNLVYLPRFLLA